MISEKRIQKLVLEAVKNIKASDLVYKDWHLDGATVVLGTQSPMDSIAFTAFVTDLEEKIEDEIKRPYTLNIEDLYRDDDAKGNGICVDKLARHILVGLPAKI